MAEKEIIVSKMPSPTHATFSVDSALLSELGEKLVPTPHLALVELVKNAYDADATEVRVTIEEDENGLPEITISDNGIGMTLSDIRRFWMRIGTANKVQNPTSIRYGRRKTGAKGIGRFCARRLGRILELTSIASAKDQKLEHSVLNFRWLEFKPGDLVTSVNVPCEHKFVSVGHTGVTLKIKGATDNEWSSRGFSFLKRQLAILTSNRGARRPGYVPDPGFKVYLHAPGLEDEAVAITDFRHNLFKAGWGTLDASIDKEGHAVCTLTALGLNGKQVIRSSQPFTGLTDVHLRLAILVEDPNWIRDKSIFSKSSIKEIIQNWGGVQVRHLGFRVPPYGDRYNDWLGIDRDKGARHGKPRDSQLFEFAHGLEGVDPGRSLLNILSHQAFLGEVNIGQKQINILPKADRLGLLETPEFQQIKDFCRFAIDWAMILRDYAIRLDAHRKTQNARRALETTLQRKFKDDEAPKEAAKVLRSAIAEVKNYVPTKYAGTVTVLERSADFLAKSLTEQSANLRRLQLVASSASLTLFFHHEVKSLLGGIAGLRTEGAKLAKKLDASGRRIWTNLLEQIEDGYENLDDLVDLTSLMGTVDREEHAKTLLLRPRVVRCTRVFHRISLRYGIEFEGVERIPATLGVGPMLEGELLAMLINAFSNAIKAVIAGGRKRIIGISAVRSGKLVRIEVSDTGIGLKKEYFDSVFTPMLSDPTGELYSSLEDNLNGEDKTLLGQGSGLGLSILKNLVEHRGGSAEFQLPSGGWSTTLRIEIP